MIQLLFPSAGRTVHHRRPSELGGATHVFDDRIGGEPSFQPREGTEPGSETEAAGNGAALCTKPGDSLDRLSAADSTTSKSRQAIDQHFDFARKLHIETRLLEGSDEAQTLVDFARTNSVTQIFLAKPRRSVIPFFRRKQMAMRVIQLAKDIQVTVVANRRNRPGQPVV